MRSFDEAYAGQPPWEVGRPQDALARVEVRGSVLDVGCGTGEHALHYAARGHEAWGLDASPRAIARARGKTAERGLAVTFVVGDALELDRLGRTFDTAIDSGLFHVLDDDERPRYARSLGSVLNPGGVLYLLCFSDRTPGVAGPRRVSQAEIRDTFRDGWAVERIEEARFEVAYGFDRPQAWLATIHRLP